MSLFSKCFRRRRAASLIASVLSAAALAATTVPAWATPVEAEADQGSIGAFINRQLDDIGDGRNTLEALIALARLGPKARDAVDPLMRATPADDTQAWPFLVTLAHIGEPADRVGSFLANRCEGKEARPAAFAALALMGERARVATPKVGKLFDEAYGLYEDRQEDLANRGLAGHDPYAHHPRTQRSFDAAVALLAVDPKYPGAAAAVARLLSDDPYTNARTGVPAYATIVMAQEQLSDRLDYWYGVAVARAIEGIRQTPELRKSLAHAIVDGVYADVSFAKTHDKDGRLLGQPPAGPAETQWLDAMNRFQQDGQGVEELQRLSGRRATRSFVCWSLRETTAAAWTQEERDLDKAILELAERKADPAEGMNQREQSKKVKEVLDWMHRFYVGVSVSPAPDADAEAVGLLGHSDPGTLDFLRSLMSPGLDPHVRARAYLAAGRLGKGAGPLADALAEASRSDLSPTVRRAAAWALGRVGG